MRAGAILDKGKAGVLQREDPQPKRGEILIRVKYCALCTHEQRVFLGITHPQLPYISGHEISGVVEQCGEGTVEHWMPGEWVTARTLFSCGLCEACRRGMGNLCIHASQGIDPKTAGLSEYIVLPEEQVFRLPDHIRHEHAALTEPLACVVHSLRQCHLELCDDIAIFGAGMMGLLHVQVARYMGVRALVIEPKEERRLLAKKLGAFEAIDPNMISPETAVMDMSNGMGAHAVINTTAAASVAAQAFSLTRRGGTTVMFSSVHPDIEVAMSLGSIHQKEAQLIGSYSSTVRDFEIAMKLLKNGWVTVEPFIGGIFPLTQLQQAFEAAVSGQFRIIVDLSK